MKNFQNYSSNQIITYQQSVQIQCALPKAKKSYIKYIGQNILSPEVNYRLHQLIFPKKHNEPTIRHFPAFWSQFQKTFVKRLTVIPI